MKQIVKYLAIIYLLIGVSGCYPIQESYDYKPVQADPYVNMTAWEFIESRQDVFSLLKEAIEYVDESFPEIGISKIYQQTEHKYTFCFLNDKGMEDVMKNNGNVTSVTDIDPAVLRDILLYHIIDGYYHSLDVSGSLNFDPIYVVTLWKSPKAIMTLKINDKESNTEYSRLYANYGAGASTARLAVTSNIIANNGVIHVFNNQLIYVP